MEVAPPVAPAAGQPAGSKRDLSPGGAAGAPRPKRNCAPAHPGAPDIRMSGEEPEEKAKKPPTAKAPLIPIKHSRVGPDFQARSPGALPRARRPPPFAGRARGARGAGGRVLPAARGARGALARRGAAGR